jgi:hypothetical protein
MVSFCGGSFCSQISASQSSRSRFRWLQCPSVVQNAEIDKKTKEAIVKRMPEEKIASHVMSQGSKASKS